MKLYKCSNCGKRVIPERIRKMNVNLNINSKRFCVCKTPNTAESKIQYKEEVKLIAQAITNSLPSKEETRKWMEKDGVIFKK